ncbi:MAG: hypothetical protein AABX85_01760 [Nanoarchaeota archaeon]
MGEVIEHNCLLAVAHNLHDAYSIAVALEHRGKDSTGLFAWGENGIDVLKWMGSVTDFGNKALQRIFPAERYHTFGIHGRYRTRGSTEINLKESHPHVIGGLVEDKRNHIFIRGCEKALIHNGQIEEKYLAGVDKIKLQTNCDSEALLYYYDKFGIEAILNNIPDGYTLAIADINNNGTILCRGSRGLKPGICGIKDGFDCFASESVALREIRASLKGDLDPGSIYYLRPNGKISEPRQIVAPIKRHCIFEVQYVAHPISLVDRLSVVVIRQDLGEKLAEEFHPKDAEFVTYNPESPKDAAQKYAEKLGLPLIECFYKIKDNRSFQAHTQQAREDSIYSNLHLIPHIIPAIRGKVGEVVDDSFVRGTVVKRSKYLLYEEAKVKRADFLSYTPQIGIIGKDGVSRGCDFGGIDMPSEENEHHAFLARNRTIDEISKIVGAEVYFLSMEGLREVYEKRGMPFNNLCTFCIGGEHPFK